MNSDNEFFTLKGYDKKNENEISHTMEDYLEMICRNAIKMGYIRINTLASKLNVKPPSASKMVSKLKEHGLVSYQPYGIIIPTESGWELGNYLLHRHEVLHEFFCLINHTSDELEQVEQMEHFVSHKTFESIEALLQQLKQLKEETNTAK